MLEPVLCQVRSLIKKGISIRQTAKAIGFHESTHRVRNNKKEPIYRSSAVLVRNVFTQEMGNKSVRHCVLLDKRSFSFSSFFLFLTHSQVLAIFVAQSCFTK